MTTRPTKLVKIQVRTVGTHFGCVGQLVARNGRVVAETKIRPYTFTASAIEAARELARRLGYEVYAVAV